MKQLQSKHLQPRQVLLYELIEFFSDLMVVL